MIFQIGVTSSPTSTRRLSPQVRHHGATTTVPLSGFWDLWPRLWQRPHLARRGSLLPWLQLGQPGHVLGCGDEYGPRHDAQGAHTSFSHLWLSWSGPVSRHSPTNLWKTGVESRWVAVDIWAEKTLTNVSAGIAHVFRHDYHRHEDTRPARKTGGTGKITDGAWLISPLTCHDPMNSHLLAAPHCEDSWPRDVTERRATVWVTSTHADERVHPGCTPIHDGHQDCPHAWTTAGGRLAATSAH